MTKSCATKASAALPRAQSDARSPPQTLDAPAIDHSDGRLRTAMSRVEAVLVDALSLRERPAEHGDVDTSTRLAYDRTDIALDRTYMATERTLQAWIRTTLSMISFGFTLGKLAEVLQDVEVQGPFLTRTLSITGIAYFLVVLGTLALFGAIVQHAITVRELRARGLKGKISIAAVIAILLVFIGGFAFTALVLKL
jgi:inner membrane protein YidH